MCQEKEHEWDIVRHERFDSPQNPDIINHIHPVHADIYTDKIYPRGVITVLQCKKCTEIRHVVARL